jgi:hypothetical protein
MQAARWGARVLASAVVPRVVDPEPKGAGSSALASRPAREVAVLLRTSAFLCQCTLSSGMSAWCFQLPPACPAQQNRGPLQRDELVPDDSEPLSRSASFGLLHRPLRRARPARRRPRPLPGAVAPARQPGQLVCGPTVIPRCGWRVPARGACTSSLQRHRATAVVHWWTTPLGSSNRTLLDAR